MPLPNKKVRAKLTRGATLIIKTLQDDDQPLFARIDSFAGEKPHAALLAVTEEKPELLKKLLKLIASYKAKARAKKEKAG